MVSKNIIFDTKNFDRTSLLLLIQSYYRLGMKKISVNISNNSKIINYRLNKEIYVKDLFQYMVGRLPGSKLNVADENILEILFPEIDNLTISRKMLVICQDLNKLAINFNNSIKVIKSSDMEKYELIHDKITAKISEVMRILSQKEYGVKHKNKVLFHILAQVELIVDIYKNLARIFVKKINENNFEVSEGCKTVVLLTTNSVRMWTIFFLDSSKDGAAKLGKNRTSIKEEFLRNMEGHTNFDTYVISHMIQILELLLDMTEFRFSLKIEV